MNSVAHGGRNGIIPNVFRILFSAEVAKSVDAVDSKSTIERCAGSSPAFGTKYAIKSPKGGFFCFWGLISAGLYAVSKISLYQAACEFRTDDLPPGLDTTLS